MKRLIVCTPLILFCFFGKAQQFPELETFSLKNGLKVYFLKYGKIEAMHVSVVINSGKKNEVPGQQGFNGITAELVAEGNKKYSLEEQKDKAYSIGAELSTRSDFDRTVLSASFLSKDANLGFDLMSAAILQPLLDKEKLTQNVSQAVNFNNPSKMDIAQIAQVYSNLSIYGLDNPLGRSVYKTQLKEISPEKIREFYAFNYTPKNTKIIVCGNFNTALVKALVETYFGSWQSAYGEINGVQLELPAIKKKEIAFVNRVGASQCALQWNKIAPSVKDKDFLAFTIANLIFNEVLFKQIREKGGKTYSIGSNHKPSQFSNLFTVSCSVRNSELLNTLDLFDKTLRGFSLANFSKNDFDIQITGFKTRILEKEYPEQVAAFYDPIFYDFNSRKNVLSDVAALKIEDVRKVVKKYFNPDVYKLVIVGDEMTTSSQLPKIKDLKRYSPIDLELKN